jgi:hypothetical protein
MDKSSGWRTDRGLPMPLVFDHLEPPPLPAGIVLYPETLLSD